MKLVATCNARLKRYIKRSNSIFQSAEKYIVVT